MALSNATAGLRPCIYRCLDENSSKPGYRRYADTGVDPAETTQQCYSIVQLVPPMN